MLCFRLCLIHQLSSSMTFMRRLNNSTALINLWMLWRKSRLSSYRRNSLYRSYRGHIDQTKPVHRERTFEKILLRVLSRQAKKTKIRISSSHLFYCKNYCDRCDLRQAQFTYNFIVDWTYSWSCTSWYSRICSSEYSLL